jgi:hypothetical protein
MFLVHKKGLKRDGRAPCFLTGYGGFSISEMPRYSPVTEWWLARGGVWALPNLRGGGEYGEAWHKAGMLDKKQNVFDDFIASAQWLIDNKVTSTPKLVIEGGSNGGLLTGTCLVQRPDLFGCVLVEVPLLDMLRYQNFSIARYWIPEYGSQCPVSGITGINGHPEDRFEVNPRKDLNLRFCRLPGRDPFMCSPWRSASGQALQGKSAEEGFRMTYRCRRLLQRTTVTGP